MRILLAVLLCVISLVTFVRASDQENSDNTIVVFPVVCNNFVFHKPIETWLKPLPWVEDEENVYILSLLKALEDAGLTKGLVAVKILSYLLDRPIYEILVRNGIYQDLSGKKSIDQYSFSGFDAVFY